MRFSFAAGRASRLIGCIVAALAVVPVAASAQGAAGWPNKPVRLVVPFPPGGGTDAFARPLSKVLGAQLGQPIVIDNRGGAGGTLGAEIAAKSPPDGYTWLVGAVHHTIAVSMYPKLGYDLQKDLVPVTVLSYVPNVVVVNPQRVPAKTYDEFFKYVRSNPGRLNYASAGNGTSHHLTVELYKTMTKTFMTHIPYRGAGPALADLLAGQVDFMFDGMGSALPHIKAGKLVPLAVTSEKRSPALPEIPTLAEAGVKGYDARTWYAVWAPAGTPREIVVKMREEIAKALAGKELRDAWTAVGAEPGGGTPEEMQKFVDAEIAKWARAVKDSGAKLD
ncbi:MAG TPA: tripartite tricarboxylate transporter substrate binding protein [Burkholderiaceae bacterium]|nr:tripartite tricarboxylate transporter substrate binding protein [Burkholderiaceae bacterium]